MKLNPIPVGSAVTIRPTSAYYQGNPSNPKDERGVVVKLRGYGDFLYDVKWDNGRSNNYRRTDLKYWRGAGAVRPPAVAAIKKEAVVAAPKETKPVRSLEEVVSRAELGCKECRLGTTARFAFINEKTGKYCVNRNTACHAQVLNRDYEETPTHITTHLHRTASHGREAISKQDRIVYFQWLFNDSPWSIAFLEKNAAECVERGFVLLTTKVSGPVLQGALVATRMPYEDSGRVTDFCQWVDKGLSGSLSYILASTVAIQGSEVVLSIHGGGHYAISPGDMGEKCFARFLSNQFVNLPATTYYEGGSARGVHLLFGEEEQRGRKFIKSVLEASQKGEVKTANTNPFAKALEKEVNTFKVDLLVAHLKKKGLNV